MILNVHDRMRIIEELADWINQRWHAPPEPGTSWTEHCTVSTGVLNGIVRSIAKDQHVVLNGRLKYWRLLKDEKPALFDKVRLFVKEEGSL